MYRRFDLDPYRVEAAGWNVEKLVHVAAATGRHSIDETIELDADAPARGGPDAIVGGLPPTDTVAEAIELIDRQMTAPRFRGVRPMGASMGPLPDDGVLGALAERNLVFELMAHPDQLGGSPRPNLADRRRSCVVVVEHTGWPRSSSDEERALWRVGMDALAALGGNVMCKLSGLAMPLECMRLDDLAPWLEHALEDLRGRPLHVRQQFPRRFDVRHLRRAVRHVQRCHGRPRPRIAREAVRRERRARLSLLVRPRRR